MLEDMTDRIRTLPPLPKSFHEITSICSNENGTIEQLAKVIETDPMLVANLLKVANSPLYSFRREIKSVLQAVSLFGMSTTRALTTDITVKKLLNVDIEPYGLVPEDFVHISAVQSSLMREWYGKVDREKLGTLFLSALLQETGKILIADEIVKNDEVMQFKSEIESTVNIAQVEQMYVGTTTAAVTSKIFEHWGFDETMVEAIHYADNYEDAPDEIKDYSFALKIVKTAAPMNSPLSDRSVTIAINLIEKEGYDSAVFANAVEKIIENA
ncbi:HDOD domain-containing protein [Sulfurospirillum arcachonense]|uniref:HDOD domain-containing protein n=1 Tax=Sulfurospirillum arcachonense TaxID=57666 RepID=UPI0004688552|nr:HDOD domain-containing protein [Sulfurospirillum arcachonense]